MTSGQRLIRMFAVIGLVLANAVLAIPESQAARYKAIVIEAESGKVLYSRNADGRHYPASLTKMMTLYLAFEALEGGSLSMDQRLNVSKRAAGQTPSRIGLRPGRTISVEDAILAMVTKSANDAATVLAESIAKSEVNFAKKMTETARRLGMGKTVFRNATGLPNRRQISTARDMAVLAQALITEFPQYYHYFSTTRFTWGKRTYENHNKLLQEYDGVDGLKTGYIRASGFNIATSAMRNCKRVIGIVLGGRTSKWRDRKMTHLLNIAFNRIETLQLVADKKQDKAAPEPEKPKTDEADTKQAMPNALDILAAVIKAIRSSESEPKSSEIAVVKPKPPALPKAATQQPASWGIQVGSYSAYGIAFEQTQEAVQALPRLLGTARAVVDRALGGTRRLYRARLLGITERSARNACLALIVKQFPCVPIPPDGSLVTLAER